MTKPAHFYHLYADADWTGALAEHVTALRASKIPVESYVSLVGSLPRRQEAMLWIARVWPQAHITGAKDSGYEEVTMNLLREHVRRLPGGTPVLYAHTKGSWHGGESWRQCMTKRVVRNSAKCLELLKVKDTVGCHWVTADLAAKYAPAHEFVNPHFAGNFWWATASYLKTLGPVDSTDRYGAERWIGSGSPRIKDLKPGWPVHLPAPEWTGPASMVCTALAT